MGNAPCCEASGSNRRKPDCSHLDGSSDDSDSDSDSGTKKDTMRGRSGSTNKGKKKPATSSSRDSGMSTSDEDSDEGSEGDRGGKTPKGRGKPKSVGFSQQADEPIVIGRQSNAAANRQYAASSLTVEVDEDRRGSMQMGKQSDRAACTTSKAIGRRRRRDSQENWG